MGNKDVILKLVDKYFSLEKESFDYFKRELYNPTIDPVYKEILGEGNLKKRWKIEDDSILESFDRGWEIFNSKFSDYISRNNIEYKHYKNNKIKVNKNEIKLKKHMISFYKENKTSRDICDVPMGDDFSSSIENYILKTFETIGSYKIPKSGIEIVLSLDFEDWFFCSTGETWNSCLSLQSEYMYWAGLPGLVGDKNRAMIYITNGSKKKPLSETGISDYEIVEVDKILSRSWVLLDENENLNFVNFYPSRLINRSDFNKITGIEFKGEGLYNSSKTPISFLYFESGQSAYIYQDTTSFDKNGFLERGRGFYTKNKQYDCVDEDDIFYHQHDGLFHLIKNGSDLNCCLEDFKCCYNCNGRIYSNEEFYMDGEIFCESCYNEIYTTCSCCENTSYREDMTLTGDGDDVCEHCLVDQYVQCNSCGEYHHHQSTIVIDNDNYCDSCALKIDYSECSECGEFKSEFFEEIDGSCFCEDCRRNFEEQKQLTLPLSA